MLDLGAKSGRYVVVTALADLREGFATVHRVAGRAIVLARGAGGVHAFDGTCTHAKFHFGNSRLVGGCEIECPMHGARFDAATGAVTKGPAQRPLERIAVEVADGIVRVFVDWAETP
jgi:nitrite reductase/ring-hydroxylating ferredoxin subunit